MTGEQRELHGQALGGQQLGQRPHRVGVPGEAVQDQGPIGAADGRERLGAGKYGSTHVGGCYRWRVRPGARRVTSQGPHRPTTLEADPHAVPVLERRVAARGPGDPRGARRVRPGGVRPGPHEPGDQRGAVRRGGHRRPPRHLGGHARARHRPPRGSRPHGDGRLRHGQGHPHRGQLPDGHAGLHGREDPGRGRHVQADGPPGGAAGHRRRRRRRRACGPSPSSRRRAQDRSRGISAWSSATVQRSSFSSVSVMVQFWKLRMVPPWTKKTRPVSGASSVAR